MGGRIPLKNGNAKKLHPAKKNCRKGSKNVKLGGQNPIRPSWPTTEWRPTFWGANSGGGAFSSLPGPAHSCQLPTKDVLNVTPHRFVCRFGQGWLLTDTCKVCKVQIAHCIQRAIKKNCLKGCSMGQYQKIVHIQKLCNYS